MRQPLCGMCSRMILRIGQPAGAQKDADQIRKGRWAHLGTMGTKVAKKGGKRKRGYGRGARILLILLWCARQESNLRPTA